MHWLGRSIIGATLIAASASQSLAQSLPPLIRNLPQAPETEMRAALGERVRRAFPRDIRSKTLTTLLKMDGFDISETDTGLAATIKQAAFPCVTDYIVMWNETERGRVDNLRATMKRKCV